jgi:ParB family chromosome partitioning protein
MKPVAPLLTARSTPLYHIEPERLRIIGRDTQDGPEHDLWDDHAILPPYEEYVQSAMALGILEPVICTVHDGVAFVVDGRRRVVAAREANKRLRKQHQPAITVPVVAKDGKRVGNETFSIVLVALNEIRLDDPIDVKMKKAKRLVERGANVKMVAMAFGKTVATVKNWLDALSADPSVVQAMNDGSVSATSAAILSKLPQAKQPQAVAAITAEGEKPTIDRTKRAVHALANGRIVGRRQTIERIRTVLDATESLPVDFLRGVRWCIGELDVAEVQGLATVLERAVTLRKRGRSRTEKADE